MLPIRFLLRCDRLAGAEPRCGGLPFEILGIQGAADRLAVSVLAERCRADDPAIAGRFAATGLQAELTNRVGRTVHAWLAWRRRGPDAAAEDCPLGMLSLVETGRGGRTRSSIAWLLVHPAARRQGVATALVRRAMAHVRANGGSEVWAETLSTWPAAAAFWRNCAEETISATSDAGYTHA